MAKKTKIWLIIAALFVITGLALLMVAMTGFGWDIQQLNMVNDQTNTYTITDGFSNISIDTDTADIEFVSSDDGSCKVVCCEREKMHHSVEVKDSSLCISLVDDREWFDYLAFSIESPKVTVYLPGSQWGDLTITESTGDIVIPEDLQFERMDIVTSTGDIRVQGVTTGSLSLSVSTGAIEVSGVTCEGDINVTVSTGKSLISDTVCENFVSTGDTGSISMTNTVATGRITIERDTGDVTFTSCDGAEIAVKTDTGDVKGSFLTDKVFVTHTDTGWIDVPATTTGGKCEITTDTGDIKFHIEN